VPPPGKSGFEFRNRPTESAPAPITPRTNPNTESISAENRIGIGRNVGPRSGHRGPQTSVSQLARSGRSCRPCFAREVPGRMGSSGHLGTGVPSDGPPVANAVAGRPASCGRKRSQGRGLPRAVAVVGRNDVPAPRLKRQSTDASEAAALVLAIQEFVASSDFQTALWHLVGCGWLRGGVGQANWNRSGRSFHQGISVGGRFALRMIGL
jgi:hypothetical protein